MPLMSDSNAPKRRFIWERLDHIELVLVDLRRGIELMAQQTVVRQSEFEQIKYQVASFAEGMRELENRVIALERHNSSVRLWTRVVGQVLLATLAAFLATRFF